MKVAWYLNAGQIRWEKLPESIRLRGKTYYHLIDDGSEVKKAEDTNECVIKIIIKFEDYKNRLEAIRHKYKINYLEKNKNWCE